MQAAELRGRIVDSQTGKPIAARIYIASDQGKWFFVESANPKGNAVRYDKTNWLRKDAFEKHTTVSAHPFRAELPPGKYTLTVERGKGYESSQREIDNRVIGVIPVDAIFSPVRRVSFTVEPTRVEQSTNFDRLILDIETDGSISPREALASAGATLQSLAELVASQSETPLGLGLTEAVDTTSSSPDLDLPIEDLDLSERPRNCLKRAQVNTVGELLTKNEDDLLNITNFGQKSLDEVKEKLDERLARVREGKPGNAQAAMQTFEATRPAVGAQALGIARAATEYATEYAKERHAFGRPIIKNQGIAFMLADMATEVEATRALIWKAAWLGKQRAFKNAEGSMAKMKAGRVATWTTERAIQILGGYGYVRENPVERWHRDAKIYDIFEGTEQIQQLVISRAISGICSMRAYQAPRLGCSRAIGYPASVSRLAYINQAISSTLNPSDSRYS